MQQQSLGLTANQVQIAPTVKNKDIETYHRMLAFAEAIVKLNLPIEVTLYETGYGAPSALPTDPWKYSHGNGLAIKRVEGTKSPAWLKAKKAIIELSAKHFTETERFNKIEVRRELHLELWVALTEKPSWASN